MTPCMVLCCCFQAFAQEMEELQVGLIIVCVLVAAGNLYCIRVVRLLYRRHSLEHPSGVAGHG